ncbi:MAG: acyl--CoA ligase [Burkholderiales bacterium]
MHETIHQILHQHADEAVAITALDRRALSYGKLRAHVARTVETLNQLGIARNDRVAIVLNNGLEMASAFLSVASGAAAAPLNPAYRAEEFEFYLSDLRARALIVEEGSDSPALLVADKLTIPVIRLRSGVAAGEFELLVEPSYEPGRADGHPLPLPPPSRGRVGVGGFAQGDDVALVLHTSGTTSRPKIVPLTQRNICASARNIVATLQLTPADRGLVVMPLFHIHGLIAAVLSPLSAGGSIYCTPGFNALKFFSWIEEASPTWYTAVPTMHQAILSRAERNRDVIRANPLRFIRSSSSSLPMQVLHGLERAFGAPVIESYGMTEAAHQMTSNPLPPRARKPGTVGIEAGPQVAIMDERGNLATAGSTGEVVIRGVNVSLGYENNPKANEEAYVRGWFRTGDQGVIDGEGYLTINGRLKEIINRGGEKISPREVDEVLMDHPAVAQAVAFAMPHDKLGEDIAAAIVLREGASATEKEVREFAAKRLADFKVPRKILIVDEIPKGPTGKLTRIGLATKLGLS